MWTQLTRSAVGAGTDPDSGSLEVQRGGLLVGWAHPSFGCCWPCWSCGRGQPVPAHRLINAVWGGRTRRGRRRRTCAVYAGRLAVHTCSDAVGHTLQLPAGQLDADRFAELAHSTSTTSPLSNSALMPTWRVATSLRSLPSWPRLATSILTGNGAAPQLMRALYHSGWQADAV